MQKFVPFLALDGIASQNRSVTNFTRVKFCSLTEGISARRSLEKKSCDIWLCFLYFITH